MNVRYRVTLTQYERDELGALLSGGKQRARKLKRAQILLKPHIASRMSNSWRVGERWSKQAAGQDASGAHELLN